MMLKKQGVQQGFAFLEYLILIIVFVVALMGFRFYIQRGYQGQFQKAGETFAYGRQYDPNDSRSCVFDDKIKIWYSEECFDHIKATGVCPTTACYYNIKMQCRPACAFLGGS